MSEAGELTGEDILEALAETPIGDAIASLDPYDRSKVEKALDDVLYEYGEGIERVQELEEQVRDLERDLEAAESEKADSDNEVADLRWEIDKIRNVIKDGSAGMVAEIQDILDSI